MEEITDKEIDIGEIFKNYIKVEPKVMAIETLFNNQRRRDKTNYKPPYQRNYVWDNDKATYFIESILLGTEIPPLVFFNSGDVIEVIDGRQRYETILRFVSSDSFKLKKGGLLKLKDLAKKDFRDFENELRDTIWDTKLRIIEFSFHSKPNTEIDIEDVVKKEIFKRYNSGITPLKPTEIDKAKFIEDNLNSYFRKILKDDPRLYDLVNEVFQFEKENLEVLLKKIRQQLVLHLIPISYYATKKDEIINKFYENLSEGIETEEEREILYNSFIKKISFLKEIKISLQKLGKVTNRLIFECVFWAISIVEAEGKDFNDLDTQKNKDELVKYLAENINSFQIDRSSFFTLIIERYTVTSKYFETLFGIDFTNYLKNYEGFRQTNRTLSKEKTDTDSLTKFETLRLNKPDASSITIYDISQQMKKHRFMIRPIYQRTEVINKIKSSSIIESILLGIKLPPIFIFKRDNGVSEVVDGQQRLLSIIGFLGEHYLDENKNLAKSEKNQYSLSLKNGILKELSGKKFEKLPEVLKNKILDFDLWIIEIDSKNNKDFDPIDLFIRLNYKPYPIKENTFEMWNSYVDRKIVDKIKEISNSNIDWFYLRKNNSRMENEGLITFLIYLDYKLSKNEISFDNISAFLDSYKVGDKINIRIKSKSDITKILDSPEQRKLFFDACLTFESSFLKKVTELISVDDKTSSKTKNDNFDDLLNIKRSRTNQNFYALWLMLSKVDIDKIIAERESIVKEVKSIIILMNNVESKEQFEEKIKSFWLQFS